MRIADLAGRLVLLTGSRAVGVEEASDKRFGSDSQAIYARWDEFAGWATDAPTAGAANYNEADLRPPAPAPTQLFAVGLNYKNHAAEASLDLPESPAVFTKFATSLTGPFGEVVLSGDSVDWDGPTGPWLVTPDALPDRNDLELGCTVNGETVQTGRTAELVFPVPELIARSPQRFLTPGDELVSRIEGIGEMRHRLVAAQQGESA
ncbi:fumarylacetoacetate hydrolase family protein [Amycolatopsis pithecellobii]|uniref:Fumarylacetoacetate hydrolase n=1 Tax=Amycolatopsis pithecellobii TaxID=664692 RepID=A0A6N7YTX3_9PSEU|nr:fumarylacetoacetate hydrolase family protein [Amycolatopsis pithecellobii]MTD56497.1 fumarylacetoacetate hydrolase [Amycolatopsis pithecellobii]